MLKILSLFIFFAYHPFHVSISDIRHNANRLEITQRYFYDDLETALVKFSGHTLNIVIAEKTLMDSLLTAYLFSVFTIEINNKRIPLNYLGYEIDEDALYVYLESEGITSFQSIKVHHSALTEIFEDQTNLVHVYSRNKSKSMALNSEKMYDRLQFD